MEIITVSVIVVDNNCTPAERQIIKEKAFPSDHNVEADEYFDALIHTVNPSVTPDELSEAHENSYYDFEHKGLNGNYPVNESFTVWMNVVNMAV